MPLFCNTENFNTPSICTNLDANFHHSGDKNSQLKVCSLNEHHKLHYYNIIEKIYTQMINITYTIIQTIYLYSYIIGAYTIILPCMVIRGRCLGFLHLGAVEYPMHFSLVPNKHRQQNNSTDHKLVVVFCYINDHQSTSCSGQKLIMCGDKSAMNHLKDL